MGFNLGFKGLIIRIDRAVCIKVTDNQKTSFDLIAVHLIGGSTATLGEVMAERNVPLQ